MNNTIKQQLDKITAPLPSYDDNTTFIAIPKATIEELRANPQFEINKCYLVELADYILDEPPNFTLSANWNNGVKPRNKHLKIAVNKTMGTMLQVNGFGFDYINQLDTADVYMGLWLPIQGISLISEI